MWAVFHLSRKLAGLPGIPFNPLVIYSCRLAIQDAPLMTSLYEANFAFGGSSDEVGKWNGHSFILQIPFGILNEFNSLRFALPIRRQAGGHHFRAASLPSF